MLEIGVSENEEVMIRFREKLDAVSFHPLQALAVAQALIKIATELLIEQRNEKAPDSDPSKPAAPVIHLVRPV